MFFCSDRCCDWTDVLLPLAGIDCLEPLLLFFSPIGRLPFGRTVGLGGGRWYEAVEGRYRAGPAVVVDLER